MQNQDTPGLVTTIEVTVADLDVIDTALSVAFDVSPAELDELGFSAEHIDGLQHQISECLALAIEEARR